MNNPSIQKGIAVLLEGNTPGEVAKALGIRLLELGHQVEIIDATAVKLLGSKKRSVFVIELLVRNGIIVILAQSGIKPGCSCLEVVPDSHDTADFAAEKIIDMLAETGVVSMGTTQYSPEEEEIIRKRLANLGYLE
jgi:hypothetical protein